MVPRRTSRAPVTWLIVFIALAAIPLVAIGWLGWRVLDQDQAIERQSLRDRLDSAASLTARELDRALASWTDHLPREHGDAIDAPPHTSVLVFGEGGLLTQAGVRPAYYPQTPPPANARGATAFPTLRRPAVDPDGRAVLVRKRTPNELWLVPTTGTPRKLDVDVSDSSLGTVGQISIHSEGAHFVSLGDTRERNDGSRALPASTRNDREPALIAVGALDVPANGLGGDSDPSPRRS